MEKVILNIYPTWVDIFYENGFAPFHSTKNITEAYEYCTENDFDIVAALDFPDED